MPSSPVMTVVTHSVALCAGAAAAAAVSLLLHHRQSSDSMVTYNNNKNVGAQKETTQKRIIPTTTSHSSECCFNHMLPTLPIRISQPNDNLLIAFDTRNRNPAFVIERINYNYNKQHNNKDTAATTPSRKNKRFIEDKSIPTHYHRSRNHHYRKSGYDRGHLAPAADFTTDGDIQDSFVLSNVSPQLPKFNRTLWLRVEEFVRGVAKEEEENQQLKEGDDDDDDDVETWVMTGPLWLPSSTVGKDKFRFSYEAIGHPPSLIHVPTHFFKVIVVVSKTAAQKNDSGQQFQLKKFAAFVIPHSEESDEKQSSRLRLVDCIVRLTDLEAVTGLEFFPKLLGSSNSDGSDDDVVDDDNKPLYKELADVLTDDVRPHAKHNQLLLLEDDNSKHDDENNGTLVQSRGGGGVGISKRRKKQIKQLLRDQSPFLFQHLCKNNNACFKYL